MQKQKLEKINVDRINTIELKNFLGGHCDSSSQIHEEETTPPANPNCCTDVRKTEYDDCDNFIETCLEGTCIDDCKSLGGSAGFPNAGNMGSINVGSIASMNAGSAASIMVKL